MSIVCKSCGSIVVKLRKHLCNACYSREWRRDNPDKVRQYFTSYVQKHPGKVAAIHREYREKNGDKLRGLANAKTKILKAEVVANYGGKCECCDESNAVFLTIDHINGDGRADRARDHGGWRFYTRLKKLGFPKDRYRLLCYNCNLARGFFGMCPHEAARTVNS